MKAYGELNEVVPGGGAHTIAAAVAATFYPWVSATAGLTDPAGLVGLDPAAKDTWSASEPYSIEATVAHDGEDWECVDQADAAWDATTTYAENDKCTYAGRNWIAEGASTNVVPELGSSSWTCQCINEEPAGASTFWDSLGTRGDCFVVRAGGAGIYYLLVQLQCTGVASAVTTWKVYKNGVAVAKLQGAVTNGASAAAQNLAISGFLALADGDLVGLQVAASDDGTVTLGPGEFTILRIPE